MNIIEQLEAEIAEAKERLVPLTANVTTCKTQHEAAEKARSSTQQRVSNLQSALALVSR